jgi:2-oxoisovalerate dehydrogenase E2 component (dihydrolipoyl transacylase)
MRAMVKAISEQPNLNALYDDDAGIIHQHAGIHIGIATQTPSGLMVPVVKHAEARDIWDCGIELNRIAEKAKRRHRDARRTDRLDHHHHLAGRARRHRDHAGDQLPGSRHRRRQQDDDPAGLGRHHLRAAQNDEPVLSFDHRVIDGWDAAVFVQRLKELLETPARVDI